jgi:hypothetical protein
MKTLILHGVPYNVNDTNQVFLYTKHVSKITSTSFSNASAAASTSRAEEAPQVGTYDPSTGSLHLFPDWKERAAAFLTIYRETLHTNTDEALEKARVLQGTV